ncbi:hypothetical protein [Tessaracoccus flavus]|uniref:Uncharacterized protein n=1 Tax=Tessaracoccus flavus TaxID=1610493 RepID=A0A1Q2CEH6_9ACTN|nr:hypothetical protein [Tessaracoccus flavus]AQP44501.1 hypothetical protein RPIT_06490 [Tessaracoccus flavus]SDY71416.1 hypothetical protein SAMN05428934_103243 [Tessaracoccus flavus]
MVQAMGPTYAGGTQPITKDGYDVLYLPDVNNRELIAQGEAPVFYYIPNRIRMARKEGPDKGDYLFNLVRFAGTGGEGVIGGGGDVAGGMMTFSVTGALPETTRRQAEGEITAKFSESTDVFWGLKSTRKPPMFRPAIIAQTTTSVSNMSPTEQGFPTLDPGETRGPSRGFRTLGMPRTKAHTRDAEPGATDSNLDPWYCMMQGQGSGSIDPTGTHAFSGLLGKYPASIAWAAFHGGASPLIVIQNFKLKVWSPVCTIKIDGNWDSVFQHFSAAASGRYLWAKVDAQAEFNKMRKSGKITVDVKVDTTLPGAGEIAKQMDERSDLVFNKFMEMAQKTIFDQPAPQVEAAKAESGNSFFSPWGVGLSLKYRRDENHLDLHYEETKQFAYLQDHTVASSLAGMGDEITADAEAERKYFMTVYLDDWPQRLARVVRPVASWDDKTVQFLSVQVGYPNTTGELNWAGHSFTGSDGNDPTWKFQTAKKVAGDVSNAPDGWTPDLTYVKRKVHLAEPPSETLDPFHRVQIERNVIDLDPEPNGTLLNDTTLEVRADNAGRIAVGPIGLGVMLEDKSQTVEVVIEATDRDYEPLGMPPVRFRWGFDDLDADRSWTVFSGDPEMLPYYRYKVTATVKGTLFRKGQSWTGPWVTANGNGPLIVDVPPPDGEGVVTRALVDERVRKLRELAAPTEAPAAPEEASEYLPESAPDDGPASRSTAAPTEFLSYTL